MKHIDTGKEVLLSIAVRVWYDSWLYRTSDTGWWYYNCYSSFHTHIIGTHMFLLGDDLGINFIFMKDNATRHWIVVIEKTL